MAAADLVGVGGPTLREPARPVGAEPDPAGPDPATAGLVTPDSRRTRPRPRALTISLRTLGPLLILGGWALASATGALSPDLLASPAKVVSAAADLWDGGQLQDALTVSLGRSGLGLLFGAGTGLLLGVLAGFSKLGEELLDSPMQLLRAIPFLSLTSLFMIWFGIGETARIVLIAVATAFPMYVSTSGAVRNTDRKLVEAMRSFGLRRWALVRQVVLPGALPALLSGLRLSTTLSFIALLAAEEINATEGLGYLMARAQEYSRTDIITVVILIYGVLGLTADLLIRGLERLLMPWRTAGAAR